MSITKPYTFSAGTKARANEVNADFDTLYSQVNSNISDIAQLDRDIDLVELTKADVNGNSTQRFAMANPVNPTDGVNQQTLNKSLTNVLNYIDGLIITKDSASPNDTIIVSTGSCYDSTKTVVLKLSNTTTKKNSGQGASTTYYVHIIGNDNGSSVDILISNSRTSPTLPTGYTKFRCIGSFTTNSSKQIDSINSYSNTFSNSKSEIIYWSMPNYKTGVNVSVPYYNNKYTAPYDGVFVLCGAKDSDGGGGDMRANINGTQTAFGWGEQGVGGDSYSTNYIPLKKNDVIYCHLAGSPTNTKAFSGVRSCVFYRLGV